MLKRLAGCVRQYKGASLLSPLFVVLEVIMEVIIPLLMAKLIDDGKFGGACAGICVGRIFQFGGACHRPAGF